ncbi:sulfoacetaldehyde dehydrogenase [Streptoalloteichus hindustanus]|uniref:Sulfoacetaldehyde dehydrogenase n=1 Tax=Streptoalloteichus hindustanus TaxID=2017 RepID=A0A1M5AAD1_STRHI|nr:sulfoacetaldehyde dehydrogenase [Streptoalloteichus hindustanus]
MERARAAQAEAALWSQRRVDEVVAAVGWQCYREDNARRLAELAYRETGFGNPEDLFRLHRKRVLGTMRDVHGATTVGVVEDVPELGLRRLAKPLGVIAVASPATAPCSGVAGNVIPMLKTRNAVIVSPNPRARRSAAETVRLVRVALDGVGAPVDLVQCLEIGGREAVTALMSAADTVVAAGGAGTVRRAYESGTPAISAGVGNATVIVDETADLAAAAERIAVGTSFNHGTSCSSESNVFVEETVAGQFLAELARRGGHLCDAAEADRLRRALWPDGTSLNRELVGRSAVVIAAGAGIQLSDVDGTAVLVVPVADAHRPDPLLTEKLTPVLAVLTYRGFEAAVAGVMAVLDRNGRGHSCGIHTSRQDRVLALAERMPVARVMVNQTTLSNSGSFDNGMAFTPTVASGSWGGCSQSENVTWRHFLNHTVVSRPIRSVTPDEATLFGPHRDVRGR